MATIITIHYTCEGPSCTEVATYFIYRDGKLRVMACKAHVDDAVTITRDEIE